MTTHTIRSRIRSTAFVPVAALAMLAAFAALVLTAAAALAQGAEPLTLGGAARLAAERSASAVGARARSSAADARVGQRRADWMPSLSTTAQVGARTYNSASLGIDIPAAPGGTAPFDPRGEVMGPVRSVDFRAQVTQKLVDVPSVMRWRASAADADAAHHGATAAAEAAAQRGANAYLAVLHAEARIAARAADSALAAELLDIARQQVTAGVGIALDVTRAEAQLADARARLIATRSDRDRAVLELRRELAIAPDAPLAVAGSLDIPADATADAPREDEIIRGALDRRAELRAAESERDGARLAARAARAQRLPSISLYADQGTTGRDSDRLLGTYSYGLQLSMPMFDGMRIASQTSEQRARQREADANLQDTRRRIETEVRSAVLTLAASREEVAAAEVRLHLAEQETAQARERFRNGVSGNADVITALIALNGARDLVIDALTSYHAARVSLASAQGRTTTLP